MKFSIERNVLHETLQKVASLVPPRSTILATQNVLFQAKDQQLHLSATDLEITMNSWMEADVVEEGALAIPGKLINEIVREMPDVTLTFELEENYRLLFRSDFGEYKIAGENPAEFPKQPQLSEDVTEVSLSGKILKKLIEKTSFACSTDELRPALTGVFFEMGKGQIRTVATDGHRLALMDIQYSDLPDKIVSSIISTRALNFVHRNLEDDHIARLAVGKTHALFEMNSMQLYARLIEEVFVDYHKVIPQEVNYEMVADTAELYSSIKRVSLFSNTITPQVILRIQKDHCLVEAKNIDFGGEAREKIACDFNGDEFVVGFNARYLQDILRHIDSEKVLLQFVRPDYAVVVRPEENEEGENQLMLLMPIRLEDI